MSQDSDYDDWEDDDEHDDHEGCVVGVVDYGFTPWGVMSILFTGVAEILASVATTIDALSNELEFLHHRAVDRDRFVGSVQAGLESLDRGATGL